MDCEGAEWDIIPDALKQQTLDKIDNILMEVHWNRIEDMIILLEKARFKIDKIERFGWAPLWFLAASKRKK